MTGNPQLSDMGHDTLLEALRDTIASVDDLSLTREEAYTAVLEIIERIHEFSNIPLRCVDERTQRSIPFERVASGSHQSSGSEASWLPNAGHLARKAFENMSSTDRRKQLGQFFTPEPICALACAATITPSTRSIIDPMCGTGTMLWAAVDRLRYLKTGTNARLLGVELDPLAARIAALPASPEHLANLPDVEVLCGDAFLELSGLTKQPNPNHYWGAFDAVVGNPPYIRYQNFSGMFQDTYPDVLTAFRKAAPRLTESRLADSVIRATLISEYITARNESLTTRATAAYDFLRDAVSSRRYETDKDIWLKLVASYSGLADLSLPSWLLTWKLARPGGLITYVTSSSWKNRQYAHILRYFMLRFLQPLMIVEQEGGWFDNALIPTTLMVFRARHPAEAAVPLVRRRTDHVVQQVRFKRAYNLAVPGVLEQIATRLDARDEQSRDCLSAAAAVVEAIKSLDRGVETDFWEVHQVPERSLIDTLLQEDESRHRTRSTGIQISELESSQDSERKFQVTDTRDNGEGVLPREVQQALGVAAVPPSAFVHLVDIHAYVNQGLRTGCNPFFYVRLFDKTEWDGEFPDFDLSRIVTVLRDPLEDPRQFNEFVTALRSGGHLVPSEPPSQCPPLQLVRLDEVFGSRLALFPQETLTPVVRYQREMHRYAVRGLDELADRAFVVGARATQEDYESLRNYPKDWLGTWHQRDGLEVLLSSVGAYIDEAQYTSLHRNGRIARIPSLSAVSPNVRTPPVPLTMLPLLKNSVAPPSPRWWYSLPILPRHTGALFMPRVNEGLPTTYLNQSANPALIDANFSTFTTDASGLSVAALFALLNSIWVKTVLEAMSTPMGGGALKIEAAHLRVMPLPRLEAKLQARLERLGHELAGVSLLEEGTTVINQIDTVVSAHVAELLSLDRWTVQTALQDLAAELQARRKR